MKCWQGRGVCFPIAGDQTCCLAKSCKAVILLGLPCSAANATADNIKHDVHVSCSDEMNAAALAHILVTSLQVHWCGRSSHNCISLADRGHSEAPTFCVNLCSCRILKCEVAAAISHSESTLGVNQQADCPQCNVLGFAAWDSLSILWHWHSRTQASPLMSCNISCCHQSLCCYRITRNSISLAL